jgi:hypothetical protein
VAEEEEEEEATAVVVRARSCRQRKEEEEDTHRATAEPRASCKRPERTNILLAMRMSTHAENKKVVVQTRQSQNEKDTKESLFTVLCVSIQTCEINRLKIIRCPLSGGGTSL